MSKLHTPGAWVCIDGNIFSDGFTTETPIARVYKRKSPHVTLANARLIAAAPELLEALKSFLRAPSVGSAGPGSITIAVQDFNMKAARAAIAKAEGPL